MHALQCGAPSLCRVTTGANESNAERSSTVRGSCRADIVRKETRAPLVNW